MKKRILLIASAAFAAMSVLAATPKAPTLTASMKVEGSAYTVVGTITAPTGYTYGSEKLESILRMTLVRNDVTDKVYNDTIRIFENPLPGAVIDWTDRDVKVGHQYQYLCSATINDVDYEGNPAEMTSPNSRAVEVVIGQKPAAVADFKAVSDKGNPPMTITFTAPDMDSDGNPLASLKDITLSSKIGFNGTFELIHTFSNPVPGEVCTFVWEGAEEGNSYYFQLTASTATGSSETTTTSYYCGAVSPLMPRNIKAEETGEGVKITWEAPAGGTDNGYLDPATVRYKVGRLIGYSSTPEYIPGAEDLEATEYLDTGEDLDEPTKVRYAVVAFNDLGTSQTLSTEYGIYYTVGKESEAAAIDLPFVESFEKPGQFYGFDFTHKWVNDSEWSVADFDWPIDNVSPGNKGGMGYVNFWDNEPEEDTMESPRISLKDAEYPVLTFYTTTLRETPITLSVDIMLADDSQQTVCAPFNVADQPGIEDEEYIWVRKTIELEKYAGEAEVRLLFTASHPGVEGDDEDVVGIDEIILADYPGVKDLAATTDGAELTAMISWGAPGNSFKLAPESYIVAIDGEVFEVEGTEYEFTGEAGKDYSVTVTPVYGGEISGKTSDPLPFSLEDAGVGSIVTAVGVSTYFDLNGRRVVNPAEGSVLVKRTVRADGEVTVEKIVF